MNMKNDNNLIIFDYDGTIVDSEKTIVSGVRYALEFHDYKVPDDETIRKNIGRALIPVFAELTQSSDSNIHAQLLETYRSWYKDNVGNGELTDQLYPDARDILISLKNQNFQLGIATNKSRNGLLEGINRHKIDHLFSVIKTIHDCNPKPMPDMGLECIKQMSVKKSNTIMVGDTINDALMAKNCEIKFIGVEWGFNDKSILIENGAIEIAENFIDLLNIIRSHFESSEPV